VWIFKLLKHRKLALFQNQVHRGLESAFGHALVLFRGKTLYFAVWFSKSTITSGVKTKELKKRNEMIINGFFAGIRRTYVSRASDIQNLQEEF